MRDQCSFGVAWGTHRSRTKLKSTQKWQKLRKPRTLYNWVMPLASGAPRKAKCGMTLLHSRTICHPLHEMSYLKPPLSTWVTFRGHRRGENAGILFLEMKCWFVPGNGGVYCRLPSASEQVHGMLRFWEGRIRRQEKSARTPLCPLLLVHL